MNQQRIFITGVSSGIGKALAEFYLSSGHQVFGVSRREPSSLLSNANFRFASVDLTDSIKTVETCRDLFDSVTHLDLVILNAGILGQVSDMRDLSLSDLRAQMDSNVWANKTLLDVLRKSVSEVNQIVAISSGAAVNGNRGWNGYSISKAALNMLVQLYAAEWPDPHFTALAPGLVDTAMQNYLCEHEADERFPSLERLKSQRHTVGMPKPEQAARHLADVMSRLPDQIKSGGFVDVRQLE